MSASWLRGQFAHKGAVSAFASIWEAFNLRCAAATRVGSVEKEEAPQTDFWSANPVR